MLQAEILCNEDSLRLQCGAHTLIVSMFVANFELQTMVNDGRALASPRIVGFTICVTCVCCESQVLLLLDLQLLRHSEYV